MPDGHRVRTINLDDETDRWQWRCPAGHTRWEPTNQHFYCQTCARQASQGAAVEPAFTELYNTKTGKRVPREHIRLTSDVGAWRDCHTGEEGSA
jgi:hypothetical protein